MATLHYLFIDGLLALAGSLFIAATYVPNGDLIAGAGAMLGTVIVVLEAREKKRPLLPTVSLMIGSASCGILMPGLLLYNLWPSVAERLTLHAWGALGLVCSLGAWGPLRAFVNLLQRKQDQIAKAVADKWLGSDTPPKPAAPPSNTNPQNTP